MRRVRELIACARLLRATNTQECREARCVEGAPSRRYIYRVIGMPCRIDDPALGRFPRFDPFMRSMSYAQSEPPYL